MPKKVTRSVIVDSPTNKDEFRGRGHDRTAQSLADAIRSFDDADRAIGLEGPWGSGKSSVVEIAARKLNDDAISKPISHHFFTFDIWKSQGSGFRRSFLEHFVAWAMSEFRQNRTKLMGIEEDIRGKKREITTNNQPILGWFGIVLLFLLPLFPIYYFWAKVKFDELGKQPDVDIWDYLLSAPAGVFGALALSTVLAAIHRQHFGSGGDSGFKAAISSVLLITSKQHQDHKSVQRVREIDPNDYEFQSTFRKILSIIQDDRNRVVVVLDNIDRLPRAEIQETWALVRSVFSGSSQPDAIAKSETITAIVPYDRALIEETVSESGGEARETEASVLTRLSSRELFSKTFDEVLTVAPPIMSNAKEFFSKILNQALPNQISSDHSFRTYRIFSEILRTEGGITTPRQVVSFVNDVSGLFSLHQGQFSLPTVATFLAHQDLITADPSVLNNPDKLDPKIVDLASDPDLAKHLAAMVFNVEPEFAFEVLLDVPLANAIIAPDSAELEELSKSAGFDLRVDDVVNSNAAEWQSTGDFGTAVTNFVKTFSVYDGEAKRRIVDALLSGFHRIDRLSSRGEAVEKLLPLLDIVREDERPALVADLLEKMFRDGEDLDSPDFDDGRSFAITLGKIWEYSVNLGVNNQFEGALKKFSPNPSPDFLYGLAANVAAHNLNLRDFGHVSVSQQSEEKFFEDISTEDPAEALVALRQFNAAGVLDSDDWIGVASACLKDCGVEETGEEKTADLLELACYARSKVKADRRAEISVSAIAAQGAFFRNLGDGDENTSERSIALAFFLLFEELLGKPLPTPTTTNPSGQRVQDSSSNFDKLSSYLSGKVDLNEKQADIVASQAKAAETLVPEWMKYSVANSEHLAARSVICAAFMHDPLPRLSVYGINLYLDYLVELLGSDRIEDVLLRLEPNLSKGVIEKAKLENTKPNLIRATHFSRPGGWADYHEEIERKLRAVSEKEWADHIHEYDLIAEILIAKLSTSGCSLDSTKFREPLLQEMISTLSGSEPMPGPAGAIDEMMAAVDKRHHADMWRTAREKLTDVSSASLENASRLFPITLSNIISGGDRIMSAEKDNVIRHILCPALASDNKVVLRSFKKMGSQRVSDFKKASNPGTVETLDATLGEFSRESGDREWVKEITELVEGKRRARNLFDFWWGTNKNPD